jgi:uncharacterized protein (TIGR02271 family)
MQHTLVAVFDNRTDAESAKNELLTSGFSAQEVRLSEGDQGAATGATGASIAGSSSTTSSGDHSVVSGIKHFFSELFGSDHSEHAQKYSTAVSRGHHVLTLVVANEPEVERAADIVEKYGPVDIDEQAAQWSGGTLAGDAARMGSGTQQQSASLSQQSTQGVQQGSATQGSQQRAGATESAAIPVIQEELQVGKREVQRGGVRVFQRVVETPVNETVSLREEHVNVERRPVDQPASSADLAALQEKTIELRETAEEVVVQKSARVVEEVVVGKEVGQREETVSDTLRHTEVEVEQLGADSRAATDDTYFRTHYNSNYASAGGRYEDYAPAYTYGSTMAGSDQYRGRAWDDVEPSLRSDWETRNPGGSTWEKIKAAVRHGWEKVTS